MAEFEKQPEEEKKPFYKTPLGIILIVVGVILLCCCLGGIIAFASGASVFEEVLNSPEFQGALEEAQQTIEAGQ
ncbi:MAG: hypothetical protein AB8G95_08355 [Anaerolineae bacterium]